VTAWRLSYAMPRPSRTATELEQMISDRIRANSVCPLLTVRVIRVDGRWDAFPGPIDRETYPDCLSDVIRVAAELRDAYDLVD
jgi:hypothetical protein